MKDLFTTPKLLPKQVSEIIETFDYNEDSYKECERVQKELLKIGYSCEYGLDGALFNLKPIVIGKCNRTNTDVYPSEVEGYDGYCPELDEDLYNIEFTRLDNLLNK